MKIQKIALIAGLLLLPLLMNAQENKKSYNTQEMKVIINGDKVIIDGDTLSKQSSREIISQIKWTLDAEYRRKAYENAQKAKRDIRKRDALYVKEEVLKKHPKINRESLDRLIEYMIRNDDLPTTQHYKIADVKYYDSASINARGYFYKKENSWDVEKATYYHSYRNTIFIVFSKDSYDFNRNKNFCQWLIYEGDLNNGWVVENTTAYLGAYDIEYILKSNDSKEETLYHADKCTFKTKTLK